MDAELERPKRKKLAELQRRVTQAPKPAEKLEKKEPTNEEILGSRFGDRAWEVWNAAKEQFPQIIPRVETTLVDAIKTNKIEGQIDGASLAQFFRSIGLRIRLNTQIRYAEHGELKTLQEKLKSRD